VAGCFVITAATNTWHNQWRNAWVSMALVMQVAKRCGAPASITAGQGTPAPPPRIHILVDHQVQFDCSQTAIKNNAIAPGVAGSHYAMAIAPGVAGSHCANCSMLCNPLSTPYAVPYWSTDMQETWTLHHDCAVIHVPLVHRHLVSTVGDAANR
jgi:hypothetical protein